MHGSLLTNTCSAATNRVPQVRQDLGHPLARTWWAKPALLLSARTERNRVTNAQDGHGVPARRVQAARALNESTRIVNQED